MHVRASSPLPLALVVLALAAPSRADWRDEAGYTRLRQTFLSGVPLTVADGLTQVEAGASYLPNAADTRFAHATIINRSALSGGISGHATDVALNFFGDPTSVLTAPLKVDVYSAVDWQGVGFLNAGTASLPLVEARRVQNHSWIGNYDRAQLTLTQIDNSVTNLNRRLDYAIGRDGFVSVVGVNNGAGATLPDLLCQTYHTLSVGLVNGGHSAGATAFDGAGRMKPDLVAFNSLTSFATPQVAGVASLLLEKLRTGPDAAALAAADPPRLVKALLLAGAAKEPLPSWSRASTAQPYDAVRGAGALNALLAYRILDAGPAAPSGGATVPATGWSVDSVGGNGPSSTRTYFFDVPADAAPAPFSVALVWHRAVAANLASAPLANLDLALLAVAPDTFAVGAVVDSSVSTVDNVEHLYRPALAPGRYALRVARVAGSSTPYALAWRSSPTVTLAATVEAAAESAPAVPAGITVARTGPLTSPLLVPLAWGGSAVSGTHYAAPPASVLIPAGSAVATVELTVIADSLAQGDRTVTCTVAGDFSLVAGVPAAATVTLRDKPYDAWRHARFTAPQLADPAVSGPEADPEADGLVNLLEYALGAEPLLTDAPTAAPVLGVDAEGRPTLTYLQATGRVDLVYAVEWSADLGAPGWSTGAGVVTETARVPVAGGELVTVRAEATPVLEPLQFLRLRVTRP
jgi:hypothetical protein